MCQWDFGKCWRQRSGRGLTIPRLGFNTQGLTYIV
jgi:hypothetical protein